MKPNTTYELNVFETINALHIAAAEFIIKISVKAITERGRFVISLSGGQTPQKLYSLLAQPKYSGQIDWKNTFIFWGDERCVPLNDEKNNAHQAIFILLSKVAIPESNIHRILTNLPPIAAARQYEKELTDFFQEETARFDLVLLGLGEDGHTASLFPETKVLDEQIAGVRNIYVEEQEVFRITMTAPLINQARHIAFLVEGKNKAGILKKVLTDNYQLHYPAQLINPSNGDLYWFVDSAAASLIQPTHL